MTMNENVYYAAIDPSYNGITKRTPREIEIDEEVRKRLEQLVKDTAEYKSGFSPVERDIHCFYREATALENETHNKTYGVIAKMCLSFLMMMPMYPFTKDAVYRWMEPYQYHDAQGDYHVGATRFEGTLDEWYARHYKKYRDALIKWVEG